jgi:RNA polymerase sigma-70 factor (ECF subfamily)
LQTEVERELVLKCLSGDARYYEPLVRAYEPAGRRIALGILGNAEDARDALQEAFVKAWGNLKRFDVKRPFGPWFFQILRNHCRDILRSRTSRFQREVVDEHIESRPSDHEAGPERGRERSAASELLWRGLDRIGPDHREILVLKELEGLRYPEIAQVLGIPEGTVASRLFHARHALREALEGLGVSYP